MRFSKKRFSVLVVGSLALASAIWYGTGFIFPRRITLLAKHVCWAKDSSAIFYVKNDPPRIYRYEVKTRLTRTFYVPREVLGADRRVDGIDPSPDGRSVLLMASRPDGVSPIYVYTFSLADRTSIHIRTLPSAGYNIAWLNNNAVVYGAFDRGTWVNRQDGSGERKVSSAAGLESVATDGSVFVCYDASGRQVFDGNGKLLRRLAFRNRRTSGPGLLVFASSKRCVVLPRVSGDTVALQCVDVRSGVATDVIMPNYFAKYVGISPDGRWAVYQTYGSTFFTWGPFGKPTLYLTPMPRETTKALNAPLGSR